MMNKKKNIFLLTLILVTLVSVIIHGQDSTRILQLSLQSARETALKNNPELRIKKINREITTRKLEQAQSQRIPRLFGDFNVRNNLIIPVTPVPAKAFDPNAAEGELLPLKFNTRWTTNAGLNASIDLVNPELRSGIREAKTKAEMEETDMLISENELIMNVSHAYIAAIISFEQLRLAVADTVTKARIMEMSDEQFGAGRLTNTDLNKIKADKNNTLFRYDEAEKIHENAKSQLIYYMGYNPLDPVSIIFTDNIEKIFSSFQVTVTDTPGEKNLSLIRIRQQEELTDIRLRALQAGYYPTLALNAYYGANFFDNQFNIFKGSSWYGNSYVNLGLKIPITDGFERNKKIKQLRLEKESNHLAYLTQQHKNNLDFVEAQRDVQLFQKKYTTKLINFMLAEENLKLAREKYESGRLLVGDLYEVIYNHEKEKTEYLQAAYDFVDAQLKLEASVTR